jgi:hypothetical protein
VIRQVARIPAGNRTVNQGEKLPVSVNTKKALLVWPVSHTKRIAPIRGASSRYATRAVPKTVDKNTQQSNMKATLSWFHHNTASAACSTHECRKTITQEGPAAYGLGKNMRIHVQKHNQELRTSGLPNLQKQNRLCTHGPTQQVVLQIHASPLCIMREHQRT